MRPQDSPDRRVIITNIRMSFISMVVFQVKWALAAVPALIIVTVVVFVLLALLRGSA